MRHATRTTNPAKDEWGTPDDLWQSLHAEFGFTWDMAASDANAKLSSRITKEMDALSMVEWPYGVLWINPPYSRTGEFVAKAAEQAIPGKRTIVLLIPASTTNKWFHAYIWDKARHTTRPGVEIRYLDKRVQFVGADSGAPWHSMILVFRGADALEEAA